MKTLYPQAARVIQEWVQKQQLLPGSRIPSSRELAKQFGFAYSTVDRGCQLLISQGFLVRRGYKLCIASPVLEPIRSIGTVYVLSPLEEFLRATDKILTNRRIAHKLVQLSWLDNSGIKGGLRRVLEQKPAGIILSPTMLTQSDNQMLSNLEIPIVICASNSLSAISQTSVGMDIYRGTEQVIQHLLNLGHRRMAHVAWSSIEPDAIELLDSYRKVCAQFNLKESQQNVWSVEDRGAPAVRILIDEIARKRPLITALVGDDRVGIEVINLKLVPHRFSVVGFHDLSEGRLLSPKLTTVGGADQEERARYACAELISQMEAAEAGRPRLLASQLFLRPRLILRESTRPYKQAVKSGSEIKNQKPNAFLSADPQATWRNVYPYLQKRKNPQWRQVEFTRLLNHAMSRPHGWMGSDPLLHFPPGLRSIHGVPYQVVDETKNSGKAVLTFRSPHTHSFEGRQLPTNARIMVGEHLCAFYFLHGCAFAWPINFATYHIHYEDGKIIPAPLLPLGNFPAESKNKDKSGTNIQDWWTGFEPRDFPHAHHLTVFDPVRPMEYQRTLYTLEWINPYPEIKINFIHIEVDKAAGPVLSLIAITALLVG